MAMNRELASMINPITGVAPGAHSSNVTGTVVDLQGADSCTIIAQFGATVDAGATITVEASEDAAFTTPVSITPDNGSGPGTDVWLYGPTFPVGSANSITKYAYVGGRQWRYIRVSLVAPGPTDAAVTVIRGHLSDVPA